MLQLGVVKVRIDNLGRELRRLGSEIDRDRPRSNEIGRDETPPPTAAAAAAAAPTADTESAITPAPGGASGGDAASLAASGGGEGAARDGAREGGARDGAAREGAAREGGAVTPLWGGGAGVPPQWPLEPTPMAVPPAEREVLAS